MDHSFEIRFLDPAFKPMPLRSAEMRTGRSRAARGENAVGLRCEALCDFRCGGPQFRNRHLRAGEFGGMTDIPFLELAWIRFQMELKSQSVAP